MQQSPNLQEIIRDNYNQVMERIRETALSAGRDADRIRLVVVTKTQPVDIIRCVVEAGATDLGENYIEEAVPKIETISSDAPLSWHMIGHLQSRKALFFCRYFNFLHSLDSMKLASRIDQLASTEKKVVPVWLEFNTGGEETKSGWNISHEDNWESILPEIEQILRLPSINVLGVMTVPPYTENPEDSRPYFQKLRKFQEFVIQQLHPSNFRELSIGMSSDFEVAIQEGSTCVRIGQAILGPRPR